jgi:hypothetical protein
MDDGLGFVIGASFGGFIYDRLGGKRSFQIFALIALCTCIGHIFIRPAKTHDIRKKEDATVEGENDQKRNVEEALPLNVEQTQLSQ